MRPEKLKRKKKRKEKTLLEVEGKKLDKVRDFLVENMAKQEVSTARMPCILSCRPGKGAGR